MAVEVKAFTFDEVVKDLVAKEEALQKKLAAMTPEELAEWKVAEAERQRETEEILKQLRGPGFVEVKL